MQEIIDIPLTQLHCQNNNSAKLLCCHQDCSKCALVCRHQTCKCLPNEHSECQFVYMETIVSKVAKKKKAVSKELESAFKAIENVYDSMIEQLSKDKQKLNVWRENYGLSEDQAKFLNAILQNNRTELVGSFVFKVKSGLIEENGILNEFDQKTVQKLWKKEQQKFMILRKNILDFYKNPSTNHPFIIDLTYSHMTNFKIDQENIQRLRSDSWDNIVGKNIISKTGTQNFQIQLMKSDSRHIMFGIVTEQARTVIGPHNSSDSLLYYFYNGNLYENATSLTLGKSISIGSKVRMQININKKWISWYENQSLLGSIALNDKFTKKNIYPIVSVGGLDIIKI